MIETTIPAENKSTSAAAKRKPKYAMQLATPFIELVLDATDPSGKSAALTVGFKRHDSETSQKLLVQWTELEKPLVELSKRQKAGEEISDILFEDTLNSVKAGVDSFIREQVLYMRKIQLMSLDGVKTGPLIQDSRTYDDASLWEGWDNCLDFLLDISLDFDIWRGALIKGAMKALQNVNKAKEEEAKN